MPFIGLSKPGEQVLGASLSVHDDAPLGLAKSGELTLVAFLRHTGCPFAEALAKRVSALSKETDHLACVLVCHGDPVHARSWLDKFHLHSRMRIVFDPNRELYGQWGIGYSKFGHIAHPSVGAAWLKFLFQGIRNRSASGTRWQPHATFLVNPGGAIEWMHQPRHAGELPDFLSIRKTIESYQAS